MILIILLLCVGILLSAFFSGSETGFYRVTRIRLVLDGLEGNFLAKFLLFLTNHPTLFVATTLIGNNVANYLTSLSVVLLTQMYFSHIYSAELIVPVLFAPILFVYGELLPKSLYFNAPNQLLRWGSPLFWLFTLLFAPIAVLLWLFGLVLQWLLGESPTQVRLQLARQELEKVLVEGSEAGILNASQSRLAQGLFNSAKRTLRSLSMPITRAQTVSLGSEVEAALKRAKKASLPYLLVADSKLEPIGYVRVCDLVLSQNKKIEQFESIAKISTNSSVVNSILQLQRDEKSVALVMSTNNRSIGYVTLDRLVQTILN